MVRPRTTVVTVDCTRPLFVKLYVIISPPGVPKFTFADQLPTRAGEDCACCGCCGCCGCSGWDCVGNWAGTPVGAVAGDFDADGPQDTRSSAPSKESRLRAMSP